MKTKKTAKILSLILALACMPFSGVASAAGTGTTALKDTFVNYWNEVKPFITYYVGPPVNQWNDYSTAGSDIDNDNGRTFYGTINDNTLTNADGENMITNGYDWGFRGFRYGSNSEKNWGNVIDLSTYKDTAMAVFNIKVDEGNLDGAYLSLGFSSSMWCVPGYDSNKPDNPNKIDQPGLTDTMHYFTTFVGVPLANYYDAVKGGYQKIAVPVSEFAKQNCEFRRLYAKVSNGTPDRINSELNAPFEWKLISNIGITRKDSGGSNTFKFHAKDVAFVAPKAPTAFTAENINGKIVMSWNETTDTDVSYKVVKRSGRNIEYLTPTQAGTYTDNNFIQGNAYTYSVAAIDNALGVEAESNKVIFGAASKAKEIYKDFEVGRYWSDTHTSYYTDYYTGKFRDDWGIFESKISYQDQIKDYGDGVVFRGFIHDTGYEPVNNAGCIAAGNINTGFAGYCLDNNTANYGNVYNLSNIKDGYAIFNVKINNSAENAYFVLRYVPDFWSMAGASPEGTDVGTFNGKHYREMLVGVPVSQYYDTQKGGFQRVAIPLSEFTKDKPAYKEALLSPLEFTEEKRQNFINNFPFRFDLFNAMGIARVDTDTKTVSAFSYDAKDFLIVDVEPPQKLTAVNTNNGVVLNWEDSATENVTKYDIYRNGVKLNEVNAITYTDTTVTGGNKYDYEIRAISPQFAGVYSSSSKVSVTVPLSAEIKFYKGSGAGKTETKYISAGTMTVSEYTSKADVSGYAALYSKNGALKSVVTSSLIINEYNDLVLNDVLADDTVKGFIWDAGMTPIIEVKKAEKKPLLVLAIGDSYSEDATAYLHQIAAAGGDNIDVTNLYLAGDSLQVQNNNLTNSTKAYRLDKNGVIGSIDASKLVSINEVLASDDWDYIALQQESETSGVYAQYTPYITNIATSIKTSNPNAKILLHETWAYAADYKSNAFLANYDNDAEIMYVQVKDAYNSAATAVGKIVNTNQSPAKIIPVGDAIYSLVNNKTFVGKAHKDGSNLSIPEGRFLASAVWYKALTGKTVTNAYNPGVTEANMNILLTIANK